MRLRNASLRGAFLVLEGAMEWCAPGQESPSGATYADLRMPFPQNMVFGLTPFSGRPYT